MSSRKVTNSENSAQATEAEIRQIKIGTWNLIKSFRIAVRVQFSHVANSTPGVLARVVPNDTAVSLIIAFRKTCTMLGKSLIRKEKTMSRPWERARKLMQ